MSYNVESAQVRTFADVITEVSGQVSALRDLAESAKLPSGTFTQTSAGRRLDGVHAVIVRRIDAALKTAVGKLDENAETVRVAADKYDEMEVDGQQGFDDIQAA